MPKFARFRLVTVLALVAGAVVFAAVKFGPVTEAQMRGESPLAVTVTATLDDGVTPNSTKKNPGDTINYVAAINSTGTTDATGVLYNTTLDANTTLTAGSVHASPLAFNDTFANAVGNTLFEGGITTGASTAPKVTSTAKLFDNDTISTDAIQLVSFSQGSNGATVTVNADGSFTYLPAAGFTGTDSFTYTIRNSADATLTDTGTVTMTVTSRVWYVDNSGANGTGRSTSPFNTLAGAAAVDAANDIIYVFTGSGNYTAGITLANSEKVVGNGVALVVNSITLRAAGTRPNVVNGAGNGITLGTDDMLTGFNFGNCTGGFAVQGASVGTIVINNMLISTNGGGLDLTGVGTPTAAISLDSVTSSGGTKNVNLVGLNGAIDLGSGGLSGASGNAFDVSGAGNAVITYSGTIGNTTARPVNVANKNGGSVTLSGAVTGSANGISLTTNTGATITFTGGISLSTGANAAFTATGGGTVTATQNNTTIVNTLTTTTGTALNVANTTIGAGGLTFRSISSSGAVIGINLNSTGVTGGLTVSGNGAAGTGGTILNSAGDGNAATFDGGIQMVGTNSPSLNWMNVTDSAGDARTEGIYMNNVTGTVTVANTVIANTPHNGFHLDNFNTNLTGFNFTNSTISCASGQPCQPSGSLGNDGLLVEIRGTSVLPNGLISGSTFSGVRALGVQVGANDSGRIGVNNGSPSVFVLDGTNSLVIQNNTFTGNGQGIDVDSSQVSNVTFQMLTNTVNGIPTAGGGNGSSNAINAFTAAGADTGPAAHSFVGKIDGNIIGTQGTKDSGSGFGNGIRAVVQGQNTRGDITINNNTVRECAIAVPINVIGQNGAAASGTATMRFRVTNNTLPQPSGTNVDVCGTNTPCIDAVLFILADEASPVCNVITGNNFFDATTMNGGADIYLAERIGPPAGAQLTVEGTGGSNSTYIQANNTLAGPSKFLDEGGNTSQVGINACGTFPSFQDPGEMGVAQIEFAPANAETPSALGEMAQAEIVNIQQQTVNGSPSFTAEVFARIADMISPTVNAQDRKTVRKTERATAPESGEAIALNIGTLTAGKSVTIKYAATINAASTAATVTDQGTVSGGGPGAFANVLTDDPSVAGTANPTVTRVQQPPTVANITPSVNEDAVLTFAAATFTAAFTDPNSDVPADTMQTLRITSLPANGLLKLSGATFTVPLEIPVANIGNLTYTPNANYFGPDTFNWNASDGTSFAVNPAAVNITVNAVNDVPSFTKGGDQTVFEDAGPQTVSGWATNISAGPNESAQVVDFIVTNNNNTLFATQPAVSAAGALTYTTAANANGTAIVSVKIHDDGGTTNGGVDTSAVQTFNITVNAVNDAPSFTKGADQTVNEDAAAQTVAGWATAISAGAPDESGQALNFIVTNNHNALFTVQPSVAANGTLTYTLAANANGPVIVSVSLHDNGGTANGGADTSAVQTFNINITAINDAPVVSGDGTESATTINEDTPGAGDSINTLFAGQYSDAADNQIPNGGASSPGAFSGVAVTVNGSSAATGQWQYFNSSSVWTDISTVSAATAKLFTNTTLIRFNPTPDFNGTAPTLTVHLIDNSLGFGITNGQVVDISTAGATGGTTAYSTGTVVLSQDVTAVNDAPTLNAIPDPASIPQNSGVQTINLSGITAGPANESAQAITVTAVSSNTALIPNPTVTYTSPNATGSLSYTPVAGQFGSAQITVTVTDNGGTANSGIDTTTRQFTVVVTSTCTGSNVVTTLADSGPGSLRDALANTCGGGGVTFNIPGGGNQTLQLLSPLPPINHDLTITGPTSGGSLTIKGQFTTGPLAEGAAAPFPIFTFRGATGPPPVADGAETAPAAAVINLSNINITGGSALPGVCGGAILNDHATLTLTNVTVYGNTAGQGAGICNLGTGAGTSATLNLVNSTISGNTATGEGGGISNQGQNSGNAVLNITNSTIAGNSATGGAGIANYGFNTGSGVINLKNTILSNSGSNLASDTSSGGAGGIVSLGFNLSSDAAGGDGTTVPGGFLNAPGDIRNSNAALGPLAFNGGSTETQMLLNGSRAIDQGSFVAGLTTDQRGNPRPVDFLGINNAPGGDGSDIGAVEMQISTAGEVSLSGRVLSSERGITNASVTVSGGSLSAPITVMTGRSGIYVINGLTAGETYVVTVAARRFTFDEPTRVITLNDNAADVNFAGHLAGSDRR